MTRNTPASALVGGLALFAAVTLAACGGDDGGGNGSGGLGDVDSSDMDSVAAAACDLTEPETVAEVFGGTAKGETPGIARNCEYVLQGAKAGQVDVFYFGPGSDWDMQRSQFEANRGSISEVSAVGDEAFAPDAGGGNEVVVLAGDVIFEVLAYPAGSQSNLSEDVHELASRIAADVG